MHRAHIHSVFCAAFFTPIVRAGGYRAPFQLLFEPVSQPFEPREDSNLARSCPPGNQLGYALTNELVLFFISIEAPHDRSFAAQQSLNPAAQLVFPIQIVHGLLPQMAGRTGDLTRRAVIDFQYP